MNFQKKTIKKQHIAFDNYFFLRIRYCKGYTKSIFLFYRHIKLKNNRKS